MANQETAVNPQDKPCEKCGGKLKQTGARHGLVYYKCTCCGDELSFVVPGDENPEYWQKRDQLLGRVRLGITQWETTQWNIIAADIHSFMTSYEAARADIYFKISLIACMTSGFQNLSDDRYRECKQIFKLTEKLYKVYIKNPAAFADLDEITGKAGFETYQKYRVLYKHCQNRYRSTKLIWKILMTIPKMFKIPIPGL